MTAILQKSLARTAEKGKQTGTANMKNCKKQNRERLNCLNFWVGVLNSTAKNQHSNMSMYLRYWHSYVYVINKTDPVWATARVVDAKCANFFFVSSRSLAASIRCILFKVLTARATSDFLIFWLKMVFNWW